MGPADEGGHVRRLAAVSRSKDGRMKVYRYLPLAGIAGVLLAPLLASGPVGAAITTTTQVTTASGSEKFTVANVAPKIWVEIGRAHV